MDDHRIKAEADYATNESALAGINENTDLTRSIHEVTTTIHQLLISEGKEMPT